MTATESDDPAAVETPLYGDEEAERASGVALPSLRALQAAGAIRASKVAKEHGGFRRAWSEPDVLKAAIAAALGEHLAWNIRIVAAVMAKVDPAIWETLIQIALVAPPEGHLHAPENRFVKASEHDWAIEVVDRKFVFLRVPQIMTAIIPGAAWGETDLLLGLVAKDSFHAISWRLGDREGRKAAERALGAEKFNKLYGMYRLAIAAHGNFLSKATINLSLQVRAAWRRLHGLESHFVEEALQPRKGRLE